MNIEPLLISLCVLSKVNVNDKIYLNRHGKIAIHQDNTFTAIYRTFFGESREKSLHFVNTIINDTIEKIYSLQVDTNNSINQQYVNQLIQVLNKCINGLNNLKITYKDDVYTVSYFESIIERIRFHNWFFKDMITDEYQSIMLSK